jgi:uncharacterized protein YkwD
MHTSIRRHQHLCPKGRTAAAWGSTIILALALALAAAPVGATTTRSRHSSPGGCADATLQPTSANLAQIDAATVCLINLVRTAHRLRPLRLSTPLQGVAAGQARDMVRGDYFGDNSLSGLTPLQRILATRYPQRTWRVSTAQNIGWATGPLATPTGIVQAWMASPPHRQIILTAGFHDIGVGAAAEAPSSLSQGLAGATYTIEFGQRIFSPRRGRAP